MEKKELIELLIRKNINDFSEWAKIDKSSQLEAKQSFDEKFYSNIFFIKHLYSINKDITIEEAINRVSSSGLTFNIKKTSKISKGTIKVTKNSEDELKEIIEKYKFLQKHKDLVRKAIKDNSKNYSLRVLIEGTIAIYTGKENDERLPIKKITARQYLMQVCPDLGRIIRLNYRTNTDISSFGDVIFNKKILENPLLCNRIFSILDEADKNRISSEKFTNRFLTSIIRSGVERLENHYRRMGSTEDGEQALSSLKPLGKGLINLIIINNKCKRLCKSLIEECSDLNDYYDELFCEFVLAMIENKRTEDDLVVAICLIQTSILQSDLKLWLESDLRKIFVGNKLDKIIEKVIEESVLTKKEDTMESEQEAEKEIINTENNDKELVRPDNLRKNKPSISMNITIDMDEQFKEVAVEILNRFLKNK